MDPMSLMEFFQHLKEELKNKNQSQTVGIARSQHRKPQFLFNKSAAAKGDAA